MMHIRQCAPERHRLHLFYANILAFDGYYEKQWFPYTMPISDIYGLRQAFDNIKNDPDMLERHRKIGEAVRDAVVEAGLELYQETGFSNTVTVFNVPQGTTDTAILTAMKEKMQYHVSWFLWCFCRESDPYRPYGRKCLS